MGSHVQVMVESDCCCGADKQVQGSGIDNVLLQACKHCLQSIQDSTAIHRCDEGIFQKDTHASPLTHLLLLVNQTVLLDKGAKVPVVVSSYDGQIQLPCLLLQLFLQLSLRYAVEKTKA